MAGGPTALIRQNCPLADCNYDGLLSKELACKLINLPTGGGPTGPTGATGATGSTGATGAAASPAACVLAFGAHDVGAVASSEVYLPQGFFTTAPANLIDTVVPEEGEIKNFYVRHNAASGNGNPVTYDLLINGAISGIQAVVNTGSINTQSDLANNATVSPGDRIGVRATIDDAGIVDGTVDVTATIEYNPTV